MVEDGAAGGVGFEDDDVKFDRERLSCTAPGTVREVCNTVDGCA